MKESIAVNKAYDFALSIIELHKALKQAKEFEISKQLLRSATSIGANLEEAREAMYWLRILNDSRLIEFDYTSLLFKRECSFKCVIS